MKLGSEDIYADRFSTHKLHKHEIHKESIRPDIILSMLQDELLLNGNYPTKFDNILPNMD